tara:strand:+ start:2067 stop:3434 length:1368 start_codon:yes stop_codon:yes gene_type:complete
MSVNDRIATQIKRYTKITPSNASGDGIFSFSKGNPVIRFSIAEQDAFLLAPETRLQFKFKAKQADGTNVVHTDTTNLDPKIGVQSVINTLTISSRRYATSICEQIHNYNQLVSIAHPTLSSTRDLMTQRNHEQLSVGQGILQRRQQGQPQEDLVASVQNNKVLMRKFITCGGGVNTNIGEDCSIQLYAGMFQSQNLDLRLLGGLELEITLAPDSNVFSNAGATTTYELSDVILNAPLLYKSAQQLAMPSQPSTLEFLTWSSLYNVIQSTNATITNKVGLRGCLSMLQKFVPVKYLNNYGQQADSNNNFGANAFNGWNVGMKRLTFHRNGQRYPNEYQIITERGDGDPAEEIIAEKNPQIMLNSLSAFENYKDVKHTHITSQNLATLQANNYFLGVSFDQISGQGIDLTGGTISTEIESALKDPANNVAIPFGVFTFFLNKNTLVIQPNQRIQSIE